ncbi:MAG TPA: hypothetical protein VEH06_15015 [Candidatus Bathyarchaeia archaeon]|nr:hypothetical protein [Candidatus Bathyarchaeia archaeon]
MDTLITNQITKGRSLKGARGEKGVIKHKGDGSFPLTSRLDGSILLIANFMS